MRAGTFAVVLALVFLAFSVASASPSSQYYIPAISRNVYSVNVSSISANKNVYVEIRLDDTNILSLLKWASDNNICTLAKDNDWIMPIVTYSSDANVAQRPKDYEILSSATYTFQHCYYEGTTIPITITYPTDILVDVGQLDTFNGEFNNMGHYLYVYQPYPIYDDFAGSAESWSAGCRELNIPTSAIKPFLLLGSNLIRAGSVVPSTISVYYGAAAHDVTVSKYFQFSDALPQITGKLGIGWDTVQMVSKVCYTGTPGDLYLLMIPRWA